MAKVNVCGVKVLDNLAKFSDTFKFEITLECFEPLPDGIRAFQLFVVFFSLAVVSFRSRVQVDVCWQRGR